MKIIVGLGNPGELYSQTRHNVGFMVINELAKATNIELDHRKYKCRLGEGEIAGTKVVLAKPKTWMNHSGQAVELLSANYLVKPADLLIVHDDTSLELGNIRIRKKGSSGGHNGVASIIEALGSQEFSRLRLGIGSPNEARISRRDFVLSSFSLSEKEIIQQAIKLATEAIIVAVGESIETAMNKYNLKGGSQT